MNPRISLSGFSRVTSLFLVYTSANALTISCELMLIDLFLYFIAIDPSFSNIFSEDCFFISLMDGEQEKRSLSI